MSHSEQKIIDETHSVRIINGTSIHALPLLMFADFKERVFQFFNLTLPALAVNGITLQQAFFILNKASVHVAPDTEDNRESCEILLTTMLEKWNRSQVDSLEIARSLGKYMTPGPGEKKLAEPIFETQELIDAVDRPGFAWDNLSGAEQRNLSESLSSFVSLQLEKFGKSVDTKVVVFQYRSKETSEHCVNYDQWSNWVDCKDAAEYEDICEYIQWGKPYEVRKLGVIQEESIQEKVQTLFDALKHGDEGHQNWLKAAIEAHFAGTQMPVYDPGKNSKIKVELEENEPYFILRGRDPQAPDLIENWAGDRYICEPLSGKAQSAYAVAREMRLFKTANPHIGMSRTLLATRVCPDMSRLRSWIESLNKGSAICRDKGCTGDATTLGEINNYLAGNKAAQPRLKQRYQS